MRKALIIAIINMVNNARPILSLQANMKAIDEQK